MKKLLGPKAPNKFKVSRKLAHYNSYTGRGIIECFYKGDLIKDKKKKYFIDGSLYLGEVVNKVDVYLPHGKGTSEEPEGSDKLVYSGGWSKGFKHGYGIETWLENSELYTSYKGNWKLGEKHGKGKETHNSGESFVGIWNDGLFWTGVHDNLPTDDPMRGNEYFEIRKAKIKKKIKRKNQQALSVGTLYFRDGRIYEGEFLDINPGPHGKGTLTYPDGKIEKGIWKKGEPDSIKDNNKLTEKRKKKEIASQNKINNIQIDIQYLKKNLDLNKFLKALDQLQNYFEGNSIIEKLLESYPSFIDKDGDEIDISEDAWESRNSHSDSLSNDLDKLSQLGKLLTTISKNFEIIKDDYIDINEDIYFVVIFSKINKTYYLSVERKNGRAPQATSIVYKSKKKDQVLKKMENLKNKTKKLKYLEMENIL